MSNLQILIRLHLLAIFLNLPGVKRFFRDMRNDYIKSFKKSFEEGKNKTKEWKNKNK